MVQKGPSFTQTSRLAKARAREYTLQDVFKLGYRNKEDVSNLPPYTLVVGSQNVLTNAAEQVGIRQGYLLDGPAGNQNTYGIDSSYDFLTKLGTIENLRKWGSNLEVRYVNPNTQAISWVNIYANLNAANIANFTNFWDLNTEVSMFALMVNGDNNVYEWSGGMGSFASATSNSITIQGTKTLAQLGFYTNAANVGKFQLLIDGITYSYTSITTTSTPFTGSGTTKDFIDLKRWWSQEFTSGVNASSITQVELHTNWDGFSTGGIILNGQLYTDNAGVPGTPVGPIISGGINVSGAGDQSVFFNFQQTGAPLPVTAATNYHFVVSANLPSGFNHLSVYRNTTPASGTNVSTNAGVSFASSNGPLFIIVTENDTVPQTFVGVTPDPTLATIAVGDAVIQPMIVGNTSPTTTGLPTNFNFDLISTLSNQIWYGSLISTTVYVSRTNNYKDVTFSSPQRLPAEGALLNLDSPCVGFSPQGTEMYISSGLNQWWLSNMFQQTVTVSTIPTPTETLYLQRLKTATGQGAQSQAFIARFKNSLAYISNEPIFNLLGLVQNIQTDPQVTNISDPIKYDMDAYNFAGGQSFYSNYFLYVTIPRMGVVRIYNCEKQYWEAPQLLPFSRFYNITNSTQLYAHDSNTNQSYQAFVGYNDNGNPINAVAAFPYVSQEGGSAPQKKDFNEHYTEGYIAGNTTLTLTINYDFGGFSGNYSVGIVGSNKQILFNPVIDGSLGQNTLGNQPIGSILNLPNQPANPKFRVINTFPKTPVYEYQLVFSSNDIDQQWQLLRFGPAVGAADNAPVEIKI